MLKMAVLGTVGVLPFAASTVPDANLVLNALMLLVLMFGAPRFFKGERAKAQLAEKDNTIATHEQTIRSKDARIDTLEEDMKGAELRANMAADRAEKDREVAQIMQGRYEVMSQFTAKEAVEAFKAMLEHQSNEAERRHIELMSALAGVTAGLRSQPQSHPQ